MTEDKRVTLGSLGKGSEFIFGGVRFKALFTSATDPELIQCQIAGTQANVLIANHALVLIEN